MTNVFIFAGIITTIYFIVKFIEMRFIDKESKPLKVLIKDSLFVYFSVVFGNFIAEQLKPVILEGGDGSIVSKPPAVFTDTPTF
jgi:hypothetical protein